MNKRKKPGWKTGLSKFCVTSAAAVIMMQPVVMQPGVAAAMGSQLEQVAGKGDSKEYVEQDRYAFDYTTKPDNTIRITKFRGSDPYIIIPTELAGKPVSEIGNNAFYYNTEIKGVQISEGIESIGSMAFYNNIELEEVSFPNTLKVIERDAFYGSKLQSITVPSGLMQLGDEAFAKNQITEVIFSQESLLKEISNGVFKDNQIANVQLTDNLEVIGAEAFKGNSIDNLHIPSGVRSISEEAFADNLITSLSIDEGVEKIDVRAFSNNGLKKLILPETVQTVGSKSFANNQLYNVVVLGKETELDGNAFIGNQANSSGFILQAASGSKSEEFAHKRGYTHVSNFEEVLKNEHTDMTLSGVGTAENPYLIHSRSELEILSKPLYRGKHVQLMNDIDLSSYPWMPISFSGSLNGNGFAINNMTVSEIHELDSYGFISESSGGIIIKDITFNDPLINPIGASHTNIGIVIGELSLNSGEISQLENIEINKGQIGKADDFSSIDTAGGLIGNAWINGQYPGPKVQGDEESWPLLSIEYTDIDMDINATDSTGGIIGNVFGMLTQISNSNVTGNYSGSLSHGNGTGGMVGYSEGALRVENSTVSNAMIKDETYSAGGIVGYAYGYVDMNNVQAMGQIIGDYSAGGLIGYSITDNITDYQPNVEPSTIKNSTFEGEIAGAYYSGGISGEMDNPDNGAAVPEDDKYSIIFDNVFAKGKISAIDSAGGLLGYVYDGILIRDSRFEGDVESESESAGGIAGFMDGYVNKIERTYAKGSVTNLYDGSGWGPGAAGGLIGEYYGYYLDDLSMNESIVENEIIVDSYAQVDLTGEITGGLIGTTDSDLKILRSYHTGKLDGNTVSGLVGKFYSAYENKTEQDDIEYSIRNSYSYPTYVTMLNEGNQYFDLFAAEYAGPITPDDVLIDNVYSWNDPAPFGDLSQLTGTVTPDQAKQRATYESKGWDFTNVWGIDEGDSLPYLIPNNTETPDLTDPDNGTDTGGGDDESVDPGDGNGGGGGLEACPDVRSIAVYVHVAELSKRDPHITNAIKKIEELPECKEKEEFEQRVHAIFEWLEQYEYELFLESVAKNLEWASKYEREPYFTAVQDKVGGVKDEAKQAEIQSELDSIYAGMTDRQKAAALKNATTLVGFAERYEREPYLSRAEAALEATPPSEEKTALEARFNAVMEKLGQAVEEGKLADAAEAVEKAETAGSIFAIEEAQAIVDELEDGADKDALTDRLAAIEITEEMLAVYELKLTIAGIQDTDAKSAFEQAYQAIETAEQKGSRYTASADDAMTALEPYAEDGTLAETVTTLTGYLDRVKHGQAVQAAVTTAENAIASAERYSRDMYVTRADEAIAALKELDPEYDTAELAARLQIVKDKLAEAAQEANIANAEKQIGYAERYKRDPYLSRAQAAIDALSDGDTKTALQERLDAVMN